MTEQEIKIAFPIGSRIEIIDTFYHATKGMKGTVREHMDYQAGIEFDILMRGHSLNGICKQGYGYYVNGENMRIISSLSQEASELKDSLLSEPDDVEEAIKLVEKQYQEAIKNMQDKESEYDMMRKEADRLYDRVTSSNHPLTTAKEDKLTIRTETIYKVGDKIEFVMEGSEWSGIILDADDEEFYIEYNDGGDINADWFSHSAVCRKVWATKEHPGDKFLPKRMKKPSLIHFKHESITFPKKVRENSRIKLSCIKFRL